jgi:hypothetical protein
MCEAVFRAWLQVFQEVRSGDMWNNIVCFVICIGLAQPAVVSAAALDRYSVSQPEPVNRAQTPVNARFGYVQEEVYERFRSEIQGYDQAKKEELERQFRDQARKAEKEGNNGALVHYERLIGILLMSK